MKLKWIVITVATIGCANPALALDMDLYTYNGFNETVMALQRLALIFNDGNYQSMFFVACVLGIVLGGTAFFGRQLVTNYQSNTQFSMAWLYSVVIGCVIYQATILPKGNLYVYDPVRNNFQTVGNVPDLMVLIAGMLNKVERLVVDISDTASAYPYGNEAGGVSFSLLYAATTDNNSIDDYYLFKSVKEYYKQCSPLAMTSASYTFNLNDLRSNTNSIYSVLQTMRSPSAFTTVYSGTDKGGTTYSCQDAWDNQISPAIMATTLYDQLLRTVCGKAGFNTSNAVELARCTSRIGALNSSVYDYASGDAYHLLRSSALANAIAQAMQDENPDVGVRALTNRAMMTEGIGSSMAADNWIPTARAVLFAVVLGLTPLLFCFVVTPLVWKALSVYCGLLLWLSLWGVSDVITHDIAMDQAMAALLEVKRNHMGLTAILLSPDAAMKGMAVIGKVRAQGVMIASVLSAGIFGFSAYSLSGIASSWSQTMDREGSEGANRNVNPDGRAGTLGGLQSGVSTQATMQQQGMDRMVTSQMMSSGRDVESNMSLASTMGGSGFSVQDTIKLGGQSSGGAQAGSLSAMFDYASSHAGGGQSVQDMQANMSRFNQMMNMGGTTGRENAANELKMSPDRMSEFRAYWETLQGVSGSTSMEGVKERLEHHLGREMTYKEFAGLAADFHSASLSADMQATQASRDALESMYITNRAMDIGTAQGIAAVAHMSGLSPEQLGKAVGTFRGADAAGQLEALKNYSVPEAIIASFANQSGNISRGNAVSDVANQYSGGMRAFQDQVAKYHTERDFGALLVFDNVARTMGSDYVQTSVAQNSVGVSVAMSPDRVGDYEGKLFGERTAQFLRDNGGGVVTFAMDPSQQGRTLTVSGHSGESMRVDDSVFVNSSIGLEAGQHVRTETAAAMFLTNDHEYEAKLALKQANTDVQARQTMVNSIANWFGQYVSESTSQAYTTQASASASGGAGTGNAMPVVQLNAGAGFTYSDSKSEQHQFNSLVAVSNQIMQDTEGTAIRAAFEKANSADRDHFESTGEHLSQAERTKIFDQEKYDSWYHNIQAVMNRQHVQVTNANDIGTRGTDVRKWSDETREPVQ